ncbi:XRE family transcriptional regulator [bacterium 1xD42-67]|nr:XRE family transcriptional regulator [bacterium 1xD42-67]
MNDIVLPSVRERLKPLRQEKKVTQKQMAELLGCTEQHYQRMEYGKVNLPASTVIFLADYFGVSADYLLGREKDPAEER